MEVGVEIAGLGRAALEGIPQEGEQSFGDKYRMYRDDARATDEQFAKDNQRIAIATELAGNIANPVSLVAPGLVTTGGTGARLAQSVGRGAIEGGIYGLEKERER